MAIFDEDYRVIALEDHRLTKRGVCSGTVLVIHADPDILLRREDFPVGKLLALSNLCPHHKLKHGNSIPKLVPARRSRSAILRLQEAGRGYSLISGVRRRPRNKRVGGSYAEVGLADNWFLCAHRRISTDPTYDLFG
jgi:hypothetical protein